MIRLALSARGYAPDRIPEVAALAKDAGVTELEVPLLQGGCEEARDTRDVLHREGVSAPVCAVGLSLSGDKLEEVGNALERSLSCAEILGAGVVNLYCCACPGTEPADARKTVVEAARSRMDSAQRRNIVLTLENELSPAPSVAESVDGWLGVARSVCSPHFGLTLDLANFVASGQTHVFDRLESVWPLLAHVHFKDIAPYCDETARADPGQQVFQGRDGRFLAVPLGAGIVENGSVVRRLLALPYRGRLTLESFFDAASLKHAITCVRQFLLRPVLD
ncbi:MAG: hypothetical protein CMJ18_10230 [Phycisphaeraceae bacterium]|nr:hypothetical protein [Phycisphaeraceae bacterium]